MGNKDLYVVYGKIYLFAGLLEHRVHSQRYRGSSKISVWNRLAKLRKDVLSGILTFEEIAFAAPVHTLVGWQKGSCFSTEKCVLGLSTCTLDNLLKSHLFFLEKKEIVFFWTSSDLILLSRVTLWSKSFMKICPVFQASRWLRIFCFYFLTHSHTQDTAFFRGAVSME